jgi:type II pantothenate kinase
MFGGESIDTLFAAEAMFDDAAASEPESEAEAAVEDPTTQRPRARSSVQKWPSTGFGIDIGGTLTKVVFFQPDRPRGRSNSDAVSDFVLGSESYGTTGERNLEFELESEQLGGSMHFLKFESARMESVMSSIASGQWDFGPKQLRLCATGGGAHKYLDHFKSVLHIDDVAIFDELQALVLGISHLVEVNAEECYMLRGPTVSFSRGRASTTPTHERTDEEAAIEEVTVPFMVDDDTQYPYLVVNVGSGVSIICVTASGEYTRVGGSAIGGGTFFGLTAALTGCGDYKTVLELATRGDSSKVDLLVGDIYGGDYTVEDQGIDLKASTVASSFGKFVKEEHRAKEHRSEDLARAVLLMVTGNLGSLAHMKAEEHSAKHVIFTGSYLANNPVAMRTLAYSTSVRPAPAARSLLLRLSARRGLSARSAHRLCHSCALPRVLTRDSLARRPFHSCSFMYRYISRESCSQFDSLPLTYLTIARRPVLCAPIRTTSARSQRSLSSGPRAAALRSSFGTKATSARSARCSTTSRAGKRGRRGSRVRCPLRAAAAQPRGRRTTSLRAGCECMRREIG